MYLPAGYLADGYLADGYLPDGTNAVYDEIGTGGATASGASTVFSSFTETVGGMCLVAGTATVLATMTVVGAGGAVSGAAAAIAMVRQPIVSGGARLNSSALVHLLPGGQSPQSDYLLPYPFLLCHGLRALKLLDRTQSPMRPLPTRSVLSRYADY